MTRFLSSSHPMPPAPTMRTLDEATVLSRGSPMVVLSCELRSMRGELGIVRRKGID